MMIAFDDCSLSVCQLFVCFYVLLLLAKRTSHPNVRSFGKLRAILKLVSVI